MSSSIDVKRPFFAPAVGELNTRRFTTPSYLKQAQYRSPRPLCEHSHNLLTSSLNLIAWMALLTLAFIAGKAEAKPDRSSFGISPYPIWSELSYFEREAISQIDAAQNGDPDALLSLALLASGTRNSSDYENVKRQISAFLGSFKQQNKLLLDEPWALGKALNSSMHQRFFLKNEAKSGSPSGYSEDQSRLMGVFETSEFNCISSALLYGILAESLNISASGVLLPSHAFIQLNLSNKKVEVETTSPNGYDQEHDAAFYERNSENWYNSRNLSPASYDDYLNRDVINLLKLIARNMLNQHTAQDKMDELDAARLAEIAAFIDPKYELAQVRRLYFYNREIYKLIEAKDWSSLKRLLQVSFDSVHLAALNFKQNRDIQSSYTHYLGGALLTQAHLMKTESVLDLSGTLMARAENDPVELQQAETRIVAAISVLLTKLAEQQQFDDGALVLTLIEGHLRSPAAWPDLVFWFYMKWANWYWGQRDWQGAIDTAAAALPLSAKTEHKQDLLGLVSMAYLNWTIDTLQNSELDQAQGLYQACLARFDQDTCSKSKEVVDQATKLNERKQN